MEGKEGKRYRTLGVTTEGGMLLEGREGGKERTGEESGESKERKAESQVRTGFLPGMNPG